MFLLFLFFFFFFKGKMLLKANLHRKSLKIGNLGSYSDLGVGFWPMAFC